ncbi:hypothetical protein JFY74_13020 [Pectobacterium carotovorum]|uniref:hypothetical protein n=1 Tax=Pectobacterium versatile TaxID=2488639 RepID=UPI000E30A91C|nr:hypothetical protein [Pectobacterium versatile]QQG27049.1 hypothetical protein JFY74_13020 [Pectobacterium carotovorum]
MYFYYLVLANLGFKEVTETGAGTGYYWRKYADTMIELFANEEVVMGSNKNVVFPVNINEVIFITVSDIGGYNGPNAYTLRVSNVTNTGFLISWDRFNENGIWNKKKIHYHIIAKLV